MIQHGLKCTRCQEEIYSNSRHDFVGCKCGAWFIDGGFDYQRSGGLGYIPSEPISREVDRETLPRRFKTSRKRIWTTERKEAWNKKHWDQVGKAVTERLEWWETIKNLPDKPYGDGDIDI
jgi:hypothetical protein